MRFAGKMRHAPPPWPPPRCWLGAALADTGADDGADQSACRIARSTSSRSARSAARPRSQNARGRILYDFTGNACEGYTLEFRQVAELDNGEGKISLSDLRSNTWEDGAAKSYRFASQNHLNQKLLDAVDGKAERSTGGIAVTLTKPEPRKIDLDAAIVFPTEHVRRIIEAAREGQTILEFPIYDGSETGEKVYNSLTVIGREIGPGERDLADAAAGNNVLAEAAALAGDGELFRAQQAVGRADAGLFDLLRPLRERRLAHAGARLQRLLDQRRAEEHRAQGQQALSLMQRGIDVGGKAQRFRWRSPPFSTAGTIAASAGSVHAKSTTPVPLENGLLGPARGR